MELSKKVSKNETYPPSHYGPFVSNVKTKGTANAIVLGTNGDLVSVVRYVMKFVALSFSSMIHARVIK